MDELSARARLASAPQPLPKMWIGYAAGILFLILEIVETAIAALRGVQPRYWAAALFSILIWIYWLYCVYKIHDAVGRIPGYRHSITPARAVGMHFIPIYNFYWVFKWPTALADFVAWRTKEKKMRGWVAGISILLSVIVFKLIDGFLGSMLLFTAGWYICRNLRHAFAAPPVPESSLRTPSFTFLDLR